jgi:DNA-binding GntR family transcriptional regulator
MHNNKNNDKAFLAFRKKIILTEYAPGEVITEKNLCEEFDVTRTALKAIVHKLEQMNLVELIPRVGIKITEININELLKDYEIKIYLEKMAATLATRCMNTKQVDEIGNLIEKMEIAYKSSNGSANECVNLDLTLHKTIYKNCNNKTLESFLDILQSRIIRMIVALDNDSDSSFSDDNFGMKSLKKFHKALVEKDDEKAGLYFIEHSKISIAAIREKLNSESYL